MSLTPFATVDQFYDFLGKVKPETADELAITAALRRASNSVRTLARRGIVSYLTTGIPSSSRIADAFAEATSAILSASEAVDDEGLVDATVVVGGSDWTSVSLIGVSFSKGGPRGGGAGSSGGGSEPPPGYREAYEILRNAGIFTTAVRH